eukprot:2621863-Amphidinium_carterae.2
MLDDTTQAVNNAEHLDELVQLFDQDEDRCRTPHRSLNWQHLADQVELRRAMAEVAYMSAFLRENFPDMDAWKRCNRSPILRGGSSRQLQEWLRYLEQNPQLQAGGALQEETREVLPDRVQHHWLFTSHQLMVHRHAYDFGLSTAMVAIARASLVSVAYYMERQRSLIHVFDSGQYSVRPIVSIQALPNLPGARIVVYDLLTRASWAMWLQLRYFSLRALRGRAEMRSYASTFSTAWMMHCAPYYSVIIEEARAIYVLFMWRNDALLDRGGQCCLWRRSELSHALCPTALQVQLNLCIVSLKDAHAIVCYLFVALCQVSLLECVFIFQRLMKDIALLSPVGKVDLMRGGAKRSRQEKDSSSSSSSPPRVRKKRVTLHLGGFQLPHVLFVPEESQIAVTRKLPQHLACHPSWLAVRAESWVWDCCVTSPIPTTTCWSDLVELVCNALGNKAHLYLGHRATRMQGILLATEKFAPVVRELNDWITSWTPASFKWNALGLLRHRAVARHVDRFNGSMSMAVSITTGRAALEFYSLLSSSFTRARITRRPVWFDPTQWHAVVTDSETLTIVAYLTRRCPDRETEEELNGLGFRSACPRDLPAAQCFEVANSSVAPSSSGTGELGDSSSCSCSDTDSPSSISSVDTDEINLIALTQRDAEEPLIQPTLVAVQEISPTLPFLQSEEVSSVDANMRGGAPKHQKHVRLTWEGTASGSMLKVHSNLQDSGGNALVQIHVSDLCKDACGIALVNWSSWPQISSIQSINTLLAILPGHRQFETDVPEPDSVTRSDLVIEDPSANKRFPRLVTIVVLGAQKPKEAQAPAQEQALPAPAAPIELLLEVDSRASDELNPRFIVKAMVDDALQKNGAHNKLFGFRDALEDSFLVLVAKIRLASDDAVKMLAISGKSGVFVRAASHCAALLPKHALVRLEPHQTESKPVVFLRNAQRQLGSTGGLCRSHRSFGLRAEARLAGRARAMLDVQHSHQFDWNEAVIPSMHFIARGLPAMFSSTETAKVLHDGFSWNCVPIRRVKTSLNGAAMWLVGAEAAPGALHARLGEHLVTIEPSEAREKTKAKRHLKDRGSKHVTKSQWHDTQSGHTSSLSRGWGADWDPWASSSALASGGQQRSQHEQKESGKWWQNKENRKPEGDPSGQFIPPARAVVADNTKLDALETRVAQMEKVQTTNSSQPVSVESRIGVVEHDVRSLAGQMQANFDKLFSHFETRNADGDPARKSARTEDFRGGSPPHMSELDISELETKEGFHIAFVNSCSHKGHLDNLLARSLDVVLIGESNHTAGDVHSTRKITTEGEGSLLYHLAWTKPTRTAGDQQSQGRASSGVVIVSKQYLALHPHESQSVKDMGDLGRLILRRLEVFPGTWVNIWGLYGPVVGWGNSSEGSTKFLTDVVSEILSSPNELSLLIGDFNVEFQHDIVAQATHKMNSLLDIGHLLSDEMRQQPTTYRTQNTSSRIDRAMCTPSLFRYVAALTVCTGAATGSHLPVVVTLRPCDLKVPPVLTEVLAIPEGKGERDPTKVTAWQLANAQRMADFSDALDEYNLDKAYYLWASLWEAFLQDTHPQTEEFNWEKSPEEQHASSSSALL